MIRILGLIRCFIVIILLFSCHRRTEKQIQPQRNPTTKVLVTVDTLLIERSVQERDKATLVIYSDTVRNAKTANDPSPYYSVTNFYYDNTKNLIKTENILQTTNQSVFTTYFNKDKVVKTVANTEFGLYTYYFSKDEQQTLTRNDVNKPENGMENMFRLRSLNLAREQYQIFSNKLKAGVVK